MKQTAGPYDSAFYSTYADDSYLSAKALLPVVQRFVQPKTVIDVGCGVGTWLRVWNELGTSSVVGVDGGYVEPGDLQIESRSFIPMDLSAPHAIEGAPFDLAQSLEVGEHLPAAAAARFVGFLCSLSPVVLFSAAIPFQGGTSHVNEQWPEYWAELFAANDYCVADVLRPEVWNNSDIAYYYAQNALLFVNRAHLARYPVIFDSCGVSGCPPLARVHPRKWEQRVKGVPRLEDLIAVVPSSLFAFATRVFRRARRAIA